MSKFVYLFLLSFILGIAYIFYAVQHKPFYNEGPYVNILQDTTMVMVRNFLDDGTMVRQYTDTLCLGDEDSVFQIKNLVGDKVYTCKRHFRADTAVFTGVEKVMAIGDLRYEEEGMIFEVLQAHGVIDAENNWSWGANHLVFLGNTIHKNSQITEYFWWLYHLEEQAEKAGGKLHILLGPNELRSVSRNNRTGKQFFKNSRLNFLIEQRDSLYLDGVYNWGAFFGNWLRSKNVIVKINDYIYAHGGLSLRALESEMELNWINDNIRANLRGIRNSRKLGYINLENNPYNPALFKGYFGDQIKGMKGYQMTTEEVDTLLTYYGAKGVVTGIIPAREPLQMHEGRVFVATTPLKREEKGTVLLIDQKGVRKLDDKGQLLGVKRTEDFEPFLVKRY